MFRCHMLVTPDVRPIPKGIRMIDNWGQLVVVTTKTRKEIAGSHMFLEGDVERFEAWLGGKKAWMGVGHPKEQRFELTPFG